MRDDFSEKIKRVIARRVGNVCSNPQCRRPTSGPTKDPKKSVNIGVAAHITAAAPGGPRYDRSLSGDERKDLENGIWLCQTCAKMVDSDANRFSQEILATWKTGAESHAQTLIESGYSSWVSVSKTASVVILADQIDRISGKFSDQISSGLEEMRRALQEGRRVTAIAWVESTKGDDTIWSILSNDIKARIVRFQAWLELSLTGDTNKAEQFADEARLLAPTENDTRLRALIAYEKSGPETGIELLKGQEDIDSLNLIAAFLLEMENPRETLTILDLEGTGITPNAETSRLRALAYLVEKDPNRARLEIQKGLEMEPRWISMRFTAGRIDYFSGLSSVALPNRIVHWPEPVDWVLVKQDDASLSRLREAASLFSDLVEGADKEEDQSKTLNAWYLACLANDPFRQEEANEHCCATLRADPSDHYAIAWGLVRSYDFDVRSSVKALKKLVTTGEAEVPRILALVGCYLSQGKANKSVRLLEETRLIFQKMETDVLWISWYVKSLAADGRPEGALAVIKDSKSESKLTHAMAQALQAIALKTGDWQELFQHLERSYEQTGDPILLFECCSLKASQGDWEYVSVHSEQLVKQIGTGDVLRLAAIAAYNVKHWDQCTQLLNNYQNLFTGAKLPSGLRRIRALSRQALGILPAAVAEAEELSRDDPTPENIFALAQIYFAKGDLKGLARAGGQLLTQTSCSVEQLLQLAEWVLVEDLDLAKSLWRFSVKKEIPDLAVGMALNMGYQLGLDSEVSFLFPRLRKLASSGQGGIQIGTIDDVVQIARQHSQQASKLSAIYLKGEGPIHVIADQLSRPLVEFYHSALQDNESNPDPQRQQCLLARHGGRPLMPGFPTSKPSWNLHLDITSVLLSEHLRIIDNIERVFKPLRIPKDLVKALAKMRTMVTYKQPSRLHVFQEIVEFADKPLLQVSDFEFVPKGEKTSLTEDLGENWMALLQQARATGGYVVDFLPLRKQGSTDPPPSLPEDVDHFVVNCRVVVDALRQHGPLSEDEYRDSLEKLGGEGSKAFGGPIPKLSVPLYLHANTVEVLGEAKILKVVCECFDVHVEKSQVDRAQAELKSHARGKEAASWLGSLINRIGKGIDNGTYEIIPTTASGKELEDDKLESSNQACLRDLLLSGSDKDDVIWADDRFINGYLRTENAPIIGINEVLKALVGAGSLEKVDYFEKITTLRAANVRFIPVEEDEILHHLEGARTENGKVVETQALVILRQYIAASLLGGSLLQHPSKSDGAPNKNGEIQFVISLGRSIINALVRTWELEEKDQNAQEARSWWILDNLYVDHLGMFTVTTLPRSKQDDLYIAATSLAALISQAFSLDPSKNREKTSRRRRYLDWLHQNVLDGRFEAEPHLVGAVAELLKKSLISAREEVLEKASSPLASKMLFDFYEDLPTSIQSELQRDSEFMASIGIKLLGAVSTGDLSFEATTFWKTVAEAINGRDSMIVPIGMEKHIVFHPFKHSDGRRLFHFKHPTSGKKVVGSNEFLGLLIESPSQREAALRRHRDWFDCPDLAFEHAVAEIVGIADPSARIIKAESWRSSSIALFYNSLQNQLHERSEIGQKDLIPPNPEALIGYYRLTSDVGQNTTFSDAVEIAADTLMREEGVQVAIERGVGLPSPLPAGLIDAVAQLSACERRILIRNLLKVPSSPLSRLHFVRILLSCSDTAPEYRRLAARLTHRLLNKKEKGEFEAFFAILKWVSDEFTRPTRLAGWSLTGRLSMVWAHAHRLYAMFVTSGAPIGWLRSKFEQLGQRITPEMFRRDPDYWLDVSHPRRLHRAILLLSGLSYGFSEHAGALVTDEMQMKFISEAFLNLEGPRIPVPSLLRDARLGTDSLGSFFGEERSKILCPLLGSEASKHFTRQSLRKLVEKSLETISKSKDNYSGWA